MNNHETCKSITVSIHAIERFAQRVLSIPMPDMDNGYFMDFNTITDIESMIYDVLDNFPFIYELGTGSLYSAKFNCVMIIKDFKIRTIRKRESRCRDTNGGRLNKKNKKNKEFKYKIKHDKNRLR